MMLRLAVAKILFDRHAGMLLNKEIDVCNTFINNYNEVKELMESD